MCAESSMTDILQGRSCLSRLSSYVHNAMSVVCSEGDERALAFSSTRLVRTQGLLDSHHEAYATRLLFVTESSSTTRPHSHIHIIINVLRFRSGVRGKASVMGEAPWSS